MKRCLAGAVAFLLTGLLASPASGQTGSGQFELISATPAGVPAGGQAYFDQLPYDRGSQKISADNRYVVFASPSGLIVAGDTNGRQDIFVRDRTTQTTVLISRAFDGSPANAESVMPRISANGRYVVFVSNATNLVPTADTNGFADVFVRDLQTGVTSLVSVSSAGVPANYGGHSPSISADGRYITFVSSAQGLDGGPEPNVFNTDVFVRDVVAGTTRRVSALPDGSHFIGSDSAEATISADGRRVAFVVWDNTLGGPTPTVPPNVHEGVYVRDLVTGQLILVSARPDGTPADLLVSLNPMISANGRYVTFTNWEDLDPNFPDADQESDGPYSDIFLRDLQTGITERISLPFPGGPAEESGALASVSADGRYVAYLANNLIRVRDRATGTTTVVLTPSGADPDGPHDVPAISEDGRFVFFESYATNIAAGDTNGVVDAFLFSTAPMADLSLTLTASATQPASGSNVTFTVTLTNGGPFAASGAQVRLPLPPGVTYVSDTGGGTYTAATGVWSAGDVPASSSVSIQVIGQFTATTPVTVTAQVSASSLPDPDSTPDNNAPGEDDQRSVTLVPSIADLSLTLTPNTTTPVVNSNVTLNAALTNGGPAAATGVRVRLPLPSGLTFVSASPSAAYDAATGLWTLAAVPVGAVIPSGATVGLQVVARVTSTSAIDVVAEVSAADQTDPDSTPDNSAPGEDDYAAARLTPTAPLGLIVTTAAMTVNGSDGRCSLVEAIVAANTDLPSGNAVGECAGGNGPDTILLRALDAPKDAAGVRDEYRVTAVNGIADGPNGLPSITSVITIDGGGAAITRFGATVFRLFHVAAGASLTLADVALINGRSPAGFPGAGGAGGGVLNLGTLSLINAVLSGNVAACDGGGVASLGPLSIRNTQILSNSAGCSGGGIETFYAGQLDVVDAFVRFNTAAGSGGAFMIHGTTAATLTNVTVDSNTAVADGGGLLAHGADATVAIADSRFTGNVVTAGYGGAIANGRLQPGNSSVVLVSGGTMSLTNTMVNGNRSSGSGGGIVNAGSLAALNSQITLNRTLPGAGFICGGGIFSLDALTLIGTSLQFNTAENAIGGGACAYRRVGITGSTITGNTGGSAGGLALVSLTAGLIQDTTINLNQATVDAGGGILSQGLSTLTLDNVLLQQNAAGTGGGIWANATDITTRNVRLIGNTAARQGGGITFLGASPLTMTGGLIDANVSNGLWSAVGGGGGLAIQHTGALVTLDGVTISNNRAPAGGNGGGIFNQGVLNMTGGALRGNTAQSGGALSNGTSLLQGGRVTLTSVTMEDNVATSLGGGVFAANVAAPAVASSVTIAGGMVRNNRAASGAGLFSRPNSEIAISTGTVLSGNVATAAGGAIAASGPITVTDATFSANAADEGGALFLDGPGAITRSTFNANTARLGAAVRLVSSISSFTNSTFSGNIASATGAGALHVTAPPGTPPSTSGRVNLDGVTIVGNVGNAGGILNAGYVQIVNTILAGNQRPDGTVSECAYGAIGTFQYGGNLVGRDPGCGIALVDQSISQRVVDPAMVFTHVVGPLAGNGGQTATHALRPGSIAIDGGTFCGLLDDQRAEPRGVDGDGDGTALCDVGAFEVQTPLAAPQAALASLNPATRLAGGAGSTVVVNGSGFGSGAIAQFNGVARPTFVRSPTELVMTVLAGDLVAGDDIVTNHITVVNPGGGASNPLAFVVFSPRVIAVQAQVAPPGATVVSSTAPVVATLHGVTAALTNNDAGSGPATVAVASYSSDPTGGTVFAAGGFFDVQVTGADPTDSLLARFYYPSNIPMAAEAALTLQYWTGTAWAAVIGAGGATPIKDTTNNLDGTISGGRFAVTLDNTSTPRLMDLSGTVFALIEAAGDTTTPTTRYGQYPEANARGWNNTAVTVTLTATDNVAVARTEVSVNGGSWRIYGGPFVLAGNGVHVVRFRSIDAAGNIEAAKHATVRIDKDAPLFAAVALPAILLPVNKKLVDIIVLPLALDLLSGTETVTLVSVTSSDTSTTADDIAGWSVGSTDTHGQLRAERAPGGGARIYKLRYRAVDRAGNEAFATATVQVPGGR